MISWKYSFEKIGKDLELARKKKQALDDLFNAGRISQSTYDSINRELTEAITEIEARQKVLAEKMTSKIAELEEQVNSLEIFLASSEIQFAAGEIDEELHARESSAFTLGLEAIKKELNNVKAIIASLTSGVGTPTAPPEPSEVVEAPPIEEAVEETPEISVEAPIETPAEAPAEAEPMVEETKVEQPIEEVQPETPIEESVAEEPSEVVEEAPIEEPVPEVTTEPVLEEAPIEEETEAPTEEAEPFRDEGLEATNEEEEFEEEEE